MGERRGTIRSGAKALFLIVTVAGLSVLFGCSSSERRAPEASPPGPEASEGASQPPTPRETQQPGDAGDLLADMSRDQSTRAREAQFYLDQANKKFNEADYRQAEMLYRRALDLDPTLEEAKQKLVRCLMFLGRRDGEIQSTIEAFGDEVKVVGEQRLLEAQRYLADGRAALESGDVDKALRDLERARERLIWFRYDVDVTDLREEAATLYQAARNQKLAIEDQLRRQREQEALDQAQELTAQAERDREQRIEGLLERARESLAQDEFQSALEICQQVLKIDPQNVRAKRYEKQAKEFLFAYRYLDFLEENKDQTQRVWEDLDIAAIPYEDPFRFTDDDEHWRKKVAGREARLSGLNLEESPEVQRIRRTLASISPNFEFRDEPLSGVVDFLRTVADLNITVDPEIDQEEQRVDLKLQGVKLDDALDLIMKNTGLSYTFKENTLHITTPDKAYGNLLFDIYNVTDILNKIKDFPGPSIRVKSNDEIDDSGGSSPFGGFADADEEDDEPIDPDELADLIKESTGGEEVWDESGSEISAHKGQMLITATRELHLAVKSFLQNLRQDSDVFVIVEARFIDMVDDFLEDIGVDYRNLGQPPGSGFGTAYGTLSPNGTGGTDIGFSNLGNPNNPSLVMGQDRTAGRIQHILDGFVGAAQGERLDASQRGLTLQITWLDPFQINAILRASQEQRQARTVTAPRVTASNGQRVHVSVITQRSYVQDYELVSGGTGLIVQEVADPVISTFQDGVILDVRPVISADRRYITLDVRPTLASLINGVISTVTISLGSLTQAATLVDIDLPEISLQQAFTSVTVPDGGTVLLGGFRSLNERKYESFVPLIGRVWLLKNLFRRKATLEEKRSLYILLTAQIIDLRAEEKRLFN